MWDRILPVVVIVAVFFAAGVFLFMWKSVPSEFPDPDKLKVLGTIPESWSVTDLDGKEISAGDLRGKVLFINRWATWCPPCMAEMPNIQALYKSLVGANVAFLIISEETPKKVQQMATKEGWTMPIYLATEGFPPVLETRSIPATFIADRKGRVVYHMVGGKDWNTDDARRFLQRIP